MKYLINPLEPLISRDSRPFGGQSGNKMRSLNWLSLSVIAGTIRTALWKEDTSRSPEQLKKVEIRGGFPVVNGEMYFPRPLDILMSKEAELSKIYEISPMKSDEEPLGVQMPIEGLVPCMPVGLPDEDFKPEKMDAFWSAETMFSWLKQDRKKFNIKRTLPFPQKDERTHVSITPELGTAKDEILFTTTGLDFMHKDQKQLSCISACIDVNYNGLNALPKQFIAPCGGARRLADITLDSKIESFWQAPSSLVLGKKIRMILASPAVFEKGWLPGWIDEISREGVIPGTAAKVRLTAAITERWQPLSGWNYERGKNGPKALRRVVPAGSVYFFELVSGALEIDSVWLHSVCDLKQDKLDGFGLALWGNW